MTIPIKSPSARLTTEHLAMQEAALSSSLSKASSSAGSSTNTSPRAPVARLPEDFDIVAHYAELLQRDSNIAMPVAAIECLSQLIARSEAQTMSELIAELTAGAELLQRSSFNPVALTAGVDLLLRFVTLQRPSGHQPFSMHKRDLVVRAKEFIYDSHRCIDKIVDYACGLIKDDAVVLTHSHSRVVVQSLIQAAKQRKRFRVYVTESRPFGLGIKTHAVLTRAGIPCQIVLDSAVSFVINKIDMVLLGAEALAENGGLVNFVGSSQMALIAKAAEKPVYALAESFKFLRIFPLDQYDLPVSVPVLRFESGASETARDVERPKEIIIPPTPSRPLVDSPTPEALQMTPEQIQNNPLVDYTTPDLVTLVISDVGILTPAGVSDTLLRIYSG